MLELWRTAAAFRSATDDEPALVGLLDQDPGSLLVADDDGEIVGAVIAAWDGWRGNLYRLAVAPVRRRRGIGRALVADAERRLRARGARRISALVVESAGGADAFWTSAGYLPDAAVGRCVKDLPG